MKIRHKKNKHRSFPFRLRLFRNFKKLEWNFVFDKSCRYNHNNEDQLDWNKACGITWKLRAIDENIMIGWRYNEKVDCIEMTLYQNKDGKKVISDRIFSIGHHKQATIIFKKVKGKIVIFEQFTNFWFGEVPHKKKRLYREINSWFGGTLPSPGNLFFWKKFTRL